MSRPSEIRLTQVPLLKTHNPVKAYLLITVMGGDYRPLQIKRKLEKELGRALVMGGDYFTTLHVYGPLLPDETWDIFVKLVEEALRHHLPNCGVIVE